MSAWVPENRIDFHWGDVFLCEPDWSWSVRDLPYLDMWYVTEGVGWISEKGRRELASELRGWKCVWRALSRFSDALASRG